jgi:TolA-binding protein
LFVADYPADSNAARYLVRCAQVIQNNLNDKVRANELYLDVMTRYPKDKSAALANFLLANNFNDMNDSLNAVRYLDLYLDKYPNHELVPAARDLKRYVEMPAAEKKKIFSSPKEPAS